MIKEYREALGLSQREFAALMSRDIPGVDKALISKMENGLVAPSKAMIAWCCNGPNSPVGEPNGVKGITGQIKPKSSEKAGYSPLDWSVFEKLQHTDFDHRVSRGMLVALCGSTDRQVRASIETLRRSGVRIGSGCGAAGYWLIRSDDEYKRFIREYVSRAYEVLRVKAAMDSSVEGQLEWDL